MAHSFNEARLEKFIASFCEEPMPRKPEGIRLQFLTAVEPIERQVAKIGVFKTASIAKKLPNGPMTRDDLSNFIAQPTTSTRTAIITILCWGHISSDDLRGYLLSNRKEIDEFEGVVNWIRELKPTRSDAYYVLSKMRQSPQREHWRLHGVGVAYFTKVIFFFTREYKKPGYIMDQFSSRSANFLCDKTMIKMDSGKVVTDRNTVSNYDSFCECVEQLAKEVSIRRKETVKPEDIERAMFSSKSGEWRQYLTTNDEAGRQKAVKKATKAAQKSLKAALTKKKRA